MLEDQAPQTRFQTAFQLRQVEIRARAALDERLRIVEDIEAEIEQRAGHGNAIDQDMALVQVPAARADDQDGGVIIDLIALAILGIGEIDLATDGVAQIDLAFHEVRPERCRGVLEIGHEAFGAGIQRVDDHLAVDRAGNLDAAVLQIGRGRTHGPFAGADVRGFVREHQQRALVQLFLAFLAVTQQGLAALFEAAVQAGEEAQRLVGENVAIAGFQMAQNFDTGGSSESHDRLLWG